jgi:hypothetical protein
MVAVVIAMLSPGCTPEQTWRILLALVVVYLQQRRGQA